MTRALAALTLLAIVVLTVAQGGASTAHANYFRSSPAPNERIEASPPRIVIAFSEAPDPKQSGIDLLASDGHTVVSGATSTADPTELALAVPPLDAATYLVAWHTVSAVDGDPAHGYFAFAVGPDTPASGSVLLTGDASGIRATLTVAPARVGSNRYRVRVVDGADMSLANVTRIRLLVTDMDRDLGTSVVLLAQDGGDYATTGMDLGLAGHFGVQLEVRRRDILDDLVYHFTVTVPQAAQLSPSATATATASSEAPAAPNTAPPIVLIAAGIAVVAVIAGGVLVARRR